MKGNDIDDATLAAAVETGSEHPIATAIVAGARDRGLTIPAVQDARALPGAGMEATLDGRTLHIGRPTDEDRTDGTAGPALERKGDIASFLTTLEPGSVFFVDEIHRLNRAIEETLYPAMEDRKLPVVLGQGAGARTVELELPAFTLVGATTRAGLLSTPLRDRFGVSHRLEHYDAADLGLIVERSARILGVEIEPSGTLAIASRSRGTPRVANRLLKRVRDYAEVRHGGVITDEVATAALEMLEVDEGGLDRHDRAILDAIAVKFSGGPVGLSTLAAAVDEEPDTIEDVYEPFLLQQGLIKRTPRGRVVTERGFEHLGLPTPSGHASLF